MKQREFVRPPTFKTGDYVRVKDSFALENMNGMQHTREQLGKPPYVFLEVAGSTPEFGVEVYIRSADQRQFPLRLHPGAPADAQVHVYESGVIQIPLRFLEKVTPPTPELTPGRIVRVKLDVLARILPPFQYEGVKARYEKKECKILRIVETEDVQDPTITHYYAVIVPTDSPDTAAIHSLPVEALETVH